MHPELLNNSLFLRYYVQWQKNPDSIVFAPIADYLLYYGMAEDALKICDEGLKRHPRLTVGHLIMAKVQLKRGKLDEAEEALRMALQITPKNQRAEELLVTIEEARNGHPLGDDFGALNVERPPPETAQSMPSEWQTITMAKIFAQQGHIDRAREIYQAILEREPQNEDARRGLASIHS